MSTASMKPRFIALMALILCPLAWGACGEDRSEPTSTGTGGTGEAVDDGTYASSPCGMCEADACHDERLNCRAEPSCASYLDCLSACPVDDQGNPLADYELACPMPEGDVAASAKHALDECRYLGPGSDCPSCQVGSEPALPLLAQSCPASTDPAPCTWCLHESCCESLDRCVNDPACLALSACRDTCAGDSVCDLACFDEHPEGARSYVEHAACMALSCSDHCSDFGGPCRSCLVEECQTSYVLCLADPDCFVATMCVAECDFDLECDHPCMAAVTADQLGRIVNLVECRLAACSDACAF